MSVPSPAGRGLHDQPGDACGLGTGVATGNVLQHDADRGDRLTLVVEREPDEPSMRIGALGVLRGAGLATDGIPVDLRVLAGAVLDDTDHHVLELRGDAAVDRAAQLLRRGAVDRPT